MNGFFSSAPIDATQWGEGSRALLENFLNDVANSRLKVKILGVFLSDSGLCLSSERLAVRLGETPPDTRLAVRQLGIERVLHYCPQFAFADLCTLSLPSLAPTAQLQLGLLRFALRHEPEWVWRRFDAPNQEGHGAPVALHKSPQVAS